MKTTFIVVDEKKYIAQYDEDNIFASREEFHCREFMIHIELFDDKPERVTMSVACENIPLDIDYEDSDTHNLIRHYLKKAESYVRK